MMKIFLSYRRDDTRDFTERLQDFLESNVRGIDTIFQDVDAIPFGEKFAPFIKSKIEDCDVFLLMIGGNWERIMIERSSLPEEDFVRVEIETALALKEQYGLLIVPVLVDDTKMPDAAKLPKSIQQICDLNAPHIRRNPNFKQDSRKLIKDIRETLKNNPRKNKPFSLPLLEWVPVSAGETILRRDEITRQPRRIAHVKAFEISKYPVTVKQYAAFVEDEGYKTKELESLNNGSPLDLPSFSSDEHPRIYVTITEAIAFCRWLSQKTGYTIRLPTEGEWQRSAHGDDIKRLYSWGDEWDTKHCNCKGINQGTISVRYYEKVGISPMGVVDLCGNVYEWTTTTYKNDLIKDDKPHYAVKGGCWDDYAGTAFRIGYRILRDTNTSESYIGFRCVREIE